MAGNDDSSHMAYLRLCRKTHASTNLTNNRHSPKLLTSFASMTVPTPTVSAMVGTFERSPSKNRALAMMVSFARVFTRVLDTRLEPGSLKAMWPSGPIPDKIQWTQVWIFLLLQNDSRDELMAIVCDQHCDLLTSNKQLDPTGGCYLFLKCFTLCLQVCSIAV